MTYLTPSGHTITTYQVDDGTEFVTTNPAGEVTSTSRLSGLAAEVMIAAIERSAL